MKKFLKIIFCTVFVLSPLASRAADVNFQLQVGAPVTSSGGGGGGSGVSTSPAASFTITGLTSPNSFVEAIVGNQISGTAVAGADGSFSVKSVLDGGRPTYLRSTDVLGNVTQLSQPIILTVGAPPVVGVILPPSLAFAAASFTQGSLIIGRGRTVPGSAVSIIFTDANGVTATQLLTADASGVFNVSFNSKTLALGPLNIQVAVNFGGKSASSSYGLSIVATPVTTPPKCPQVEDFNCDGKVNLQDLSIMLAHYGQKNPPGQFDLNHDGKINLIDFSIFLYYLNRPIKIAFVSAPVVAASADVIAPAIALDIGNMPDGKLAAAFVATDGQSDVKNIEISLDYGHNWRPAESPYLLGMAKPNAVEIRATDAAGNTRTVSAAPPICAFNLMIAALSGALVALVFALVNILILKKHE
jgi:hypothetical protein